MRKSKVLFGIRVSEWTEGALGNGLRQVEGVSAEEVDVLESERRDPGDVGLADVPSLTGELIERCLDVGRVPERNGVEGEVEGAELFLLLLAIGLLISPRSPWQTRRARRCRNSWRLSWVRMRRRFSWLST
jgi:hypothetical protein